MNRFLIVITAALTLFGCSTIRDHGKNPYQKRLFIEQFLNPSDPLDAQILRTIDDLRKNPRSAPLHNELGQLLRQKGFPKDAEMEFERAVDADSHFYPGWYNLGLMREARGDYTGARFAFMRTLHYRKGHSAALFEMGLMEEQRHNTEAAVTYYAKAFQFNRSLLDVRVNPRLLDSKLVDLALLRLYPKEHARDSSQLQPTPNGYVSPNAEVPASPQPAAKDIVTPAAPVTSPAKQTPPPPKPPA